MDDHFGNIGPWSVKGTGQYTDTYDPSLVESFTMASNAAIHGDQLIDMNLLAVLPITILMMATRF